MNFSSPLPISTTRRPAFTGRLRKATALGAVFTLATAALVGLTTTPAAADDIPEFAIAYTGNEGLYPRSSPTMAAHLDAAAEPEGTLVKDQCEITGEPVINDAGQTITTWVRTPEGQWYAGAFLNSGYLERTPGVPDCAELDSALNSPLQDSVPDPAPGASVGDRLRSGEKRIYNVSSDGQHAREYFSLSETRKVAEKIDIIANTRDGVNSWGCAIYGLGLAVVTKNASWATSTALGTAGGVGCGKFTEHLPGTEIRYSADVARAAAETGKCFEVRMHKSGDGWEPDTAGGFTSTDNEDWCG